ncbi:unnamed protein product [Calypogeia fissa]
MSVTREEEFAPVKNAPGTNVDPPDTARTMLLRLHLNWVAAAGGYVVNKGTVPAVGKRSFLCLCQTLWYLYTGSVNSELTTYLWFLYTSMYDGNVWVSEGDK